MKNKIHPEVALKCAAIILPPTERLTPEQRKTHADVIEHRERAEQRQPDHDWNGLRRLFGSPEATEYFGQAFERKLIALAWLKDPKCFGGQSLAAVAEKNGIKRQALHNYARQARRIFDIRNT